MSLSASRTRLMMTAQTRPRLPSHVRLHHDPVRGAWALLSPEKVMWPDEVSLDILRLCDGAATADGIVEQLALDYDADPETVRADVMEFLQTWADRRLVTA
ncbi:MAG: pyrroloquinoline quinone biosynthesis peptide chaperone PqqD [Anderseniella sp.]|jgi:pyrroloquinoline quinone biosynthesis protein D|nr:pyrroloquinoline quinone biosynthesis peptide chaperone PqqD [Anderseniella sp.]